MKRAFQISLFLNLLLAVGITWLCLRPSTAVSPKSSNAPAATAQASPTPPQEAQFHWRQLESSDYRQYIDNLKAIGCPRQTIRDIITADVHSLYVARREKLDRESLQASLRTARLAALRDEENSVLTALLGPPSDSSLAIEKFAFAGQRSNNVSVPLAYRSFDFSGLNLSAQQSESVEFLRNAFQRELRDSRYDRSSLEYLKQWQTAQAQSDLMLRGMLGTRLYDQIESLPETSPVARHNN